jgi:hypothetical protein
VFAPPGLAALRLERPDRRLLDVVPEGDRVVHPREDLSRAAGAGDDQVAVVEEAPEELLLDADRFHLAEEELGRVPRDNAHLEDEPRGRDRELRGQELDRVNRAPDQTAREDQEAQVPEPLDPRRRADRHAERKRQQRGHHGLREENPVKACLVDHSLLRQKMTLDVAHGSLLRQPGRRRRRE